MAPESAPAVKMALHKMALRLLLTVSGGRG